MPKPSLPRLILVPALITLAVTALRLTGELRHWSPSLFNRNAGGGGALVGIVWLVPIFGVYLAVKLAQAGEAPASAGRTAGWAALGLALNLAVLVASVLLFPTTPVAQLALFTVGSWVAILIARRGWPALWRVLLAYGFAARLPVLATMFLSIFGDWDTHYTKPRPDFPPMGHWGLFFWTAVLPQMAIWIFVTVVLGLLFGALALALRRAPTSPAPSPAG